jgi:magnesium transporter
VPDVIVDAALYRDGVRTPGEFVLEGARSACLADDTFCWIGLFEPEEAEFEAVRKEFDLHELAVEDAVEAHQRPKLELYDDTLFVVLKPARYVDTEEAVELGEILLFIDDDFVVAVRHGAASQLVQTRRSLEAQPDELRIGPGAVLLAVVERVVDDYHRVLQGLELDIQQVEKQVFSDNSDAPTQRIYNLKREVLEFAEATIPLLDPLDRLAKGRFEAIDRELREYFRDTHDELSKVVSQVQTFRDLLTSILEANLTQVGVRQNEDMRKISAWVAIAAVPTLLAGVWGMNFDSMPELDWRFGYPVAVAIMAGISLYLYTRFKRSGWL